MKKKYQKFIKKKDKEKDRDREMEDLDKIDNNIPIVEIPMTEKQL